MSRKYEYVMAFAAIFWGAWVSDPAFAAFSSSQAYGQMLQIADEYIWGLSYLCLGIIQFALVRFGSFGQRRIGSLLGVWLWLVLVTLLAIGNATTTGIVSYTIFVLVSLVNFMEVKCECTTQYLFS
jgi:hypothetical protein